MRLHLSLFSMNRWIDWYQQGKSDLLRAWLDLEQEYDERVGFPS